MTKGVSIFYISEVLMQNLKFKWWLESSKYIMSNLKVRLITPGVGAMLKWDGALLGRLVLFSD